MSTSNNQTDTILCPLRRNQGGLFLECRERSCAWFITHYDPAQLNEKTGKPVVVNSCAVAAIGKLLSIGYVKESLHTEKLYATPLGGKPVSELAHTPEPMTTPDGTVIPPELEHLFRRKPK